mmetsp:Transcript_21179/g.24434  ORF Transcript_21179/g.24434 Transcript_21179/m.24434 type:complete len:93 (-) Transcript_21179:67-345(-)
MSVPKKKRIPKKEIHSNRNTHRHITHHVTRIGAASSPSSPSPFIITIIHYSSSSFIIHHHHHSSFITKTINHLWCLSKFEFRKKDKNIIISV